MSEGSVAEDQRTTEHQIKKSNQRLFLNTSRIYKPTRMNLNYKVYRLYECTMPYLKLMIVYKYYNP